MSRLGAALALVVCWAFLAIAASAAERLPPAALRLDALGRQDLVLQGVHAGRGLVGVASEGDGCGEDRGDLLSMLLAARDAETDASMDDRQLRDECTTFIVAGHETTAMALTWSLHLLSLHPGSERQLHDEVDRVVGSRLPTLEDLGALSFPRFVFEESMRLYPPVWVLARQSYEDHPVGGHHVPAGTVVTLSPYVTHRHPDFCEHPEVFDPERFIP